MIRHLNGGGYNGMMMLMIIIHHGLMNGPFVLHIFDGIVFKYFVNGIFQMIRQWLQW